MNYWKATIIGLGLIPYGFIILLMTFYFYAEYLVGHRVWYNNPDPVNLSIYTIYQPIIDFAGIVWFFSLPVSLVVLVMYLTKHRNNISWKPIIFFAVGQILIFLFLFKSDIPEWYFD